MFFFSILCFRPAKSTDEPEEKNLDDAAGAKSQGNCNIWDICAQNNIQL